MNDFLYLDRELTARPLRGSLSVGIIAAILCVPATLFDIEQFFRAYYVAWLFFLGLSLGSLALAMIQHLTGGADSLAERARAAAATENTAAYGTAGDSAGLGLATHFFVGPT